MIKLKPIKLEPIKLEVIKLEQIERRTLVLNVVQPGSLDVRSRSTYHKFSRRGSRYSDDRTKAFDRVGYGATELGRPVNREPRAQKDYSKLAMQASKRMKFSKDKVRTGRLICLHLRCLLQEKPVARPSVTAPSQANIPHRMDLIEQRQVPLPL